MPGKGLKMDFKITVDSVLFQRIKNGSKTFIHIDDERIQIGDDLLLVEFDESPINPPAKTPKGLTGDEIHKKAGYIYKGIASLLNPEPKTRIKQD